MSSRRRKSRSICTLIILLFLSSWPAQAQVVRVTNTYKYTGGTRYDWSVFLDEGPATLKKIRCVEYTLHPTFPNPIRRVCDSRNRFALRANGWGEFTIYVKIEWQDRHITNQPFKLDLHSRVSAKPSPRTDSVRAGNTSKYLGNGQWYWTVFIAADANTLKGVQCVEYTLHPTFPQPIQRVCQQGNVPGQAFPLSASGWGTFEVIIRVIFYDGRVIFLKHMLQFEAVQSQRQTLHKD